MLAVVAAIFASRKLAGIEGRPSPARECAFDEALRLAEELLSRLDKRWPKEPGRVGADLPAQRMSSR
jgi:hypothetical protein